jgi:ATP-dependent Clp protease adaptor protein ClpS
MGATNMAAKSAAATTTKTIVAPAQVQPRRTPMYHVVLLDDNDHSYDYVIAMLGKLFAHGQAKATMLAREVDEIGRVIVETTTLERAEFKRDQIHAFGPDSLIPRCKGSMSAILEAAPE